MWVSLLLSRFCPNVPLLSHFCPDLVSLVSPFCPLSRFWLFSVYFDLNFVPIWSSFCHCGLSFVPILSCFEPQLLGKSWGQILDKTRTELFSHFLPGHPAAGQKVDNIWTPACLIGQFQVVLWTKSCFGPRNVLLMSNHNILWTPHSLCDKLPWTKRNKSRTCWCPSIVVMGTSGCWVGHGQWPT